MRNYFQVLGLTRLTKSSDLRKAIESFDPHRLSEEGDLQSVLQNDKWCTHYRRVHLQYEAIAAAIRHPAITNVEHTHNWDQRVIEFDSAQDTTELQ